MEKENTRLLEKARDTVEKSIILLNRCIGELDGKLKETAKAKEYDIKLGSHLAYMTDQVVRVLTALRQLEKHDAALTEKLTPAQQDESVMGYLAELPVDRRALFLAMLQELDASDGVLS